MDRSNSFDLLRFLFACFVIITHSYILAGIKECDILCQITGNQVVLSYLGVIGFFIISGYLIFQSLLRSENLITYYWKRFLRLYPGLLFVILVTITLGSFVYPGGYRNYLVEEDVRKYIFENLFLYDPRFKINGIFEHNPYKSIINGSLWTLSYEFTMYILLSFLFIIKNKRRIIQFILAILFVLLLITNLFFLETLYFFENKWISFPHLVDLGCFFVAGSLLAAINCQSLIKQKLLLYFIITLITASIWIGWFASAKYFLVPIFIIFLGLQESPKISRLYGKIGDLSYGLYVFGFPVQQTLQHYFKLNYLNLMWSSLIVTFLLALISWHLIESKALRYKKLPATVNSYFQKKKPDYIAYLQKIRK